jgi:hypothetical protein
MSPPPPVGPPPSSSSSPSLVQTLTTVYLDGVELAIDFLLHRDPSAVQASLAAALPNAGPFGQFVEFAGIEAVFSAVLQSNTT